MSDAIFAVARGFLHTNLAHGATHTALFCSIAYENADDEDRSLERVE